MTTFYYCSLYVQLWITSIIFSKLTCINFIQINVRHYLILILRYRMVLYVKNSQSYNDRKSVKLFSNVPYNVLNWFHLQTTRKSCWQPEMSGWIQAAMQQNTITFENRYRIKNKHTSVLCSICKIKRSILHLHVTYLQ